MKKPTSVIQFETQRDNKTRWVKQAQREGMKLVDWITDTLNTRCQEAPMPQPFTLGNDGQDVASTNYWDHPNARAGFCFLSWNAGAARLLVPDALVGAVKDMAAATEVIVSRGQWQGRDALELLFEDHSEAPYALHLVQEQSDRMIPDSDQGSGFVVTIWTRDGKQASAPGKYRSVATLPCLSPWSEQ